MADSAQPPRGDRRAYERYLAGMDASMRQKVALTAAHLLCAGKVADMGMGSGAGSHALAALYPDLEVVGVDVDPNMVALARDEYRLPNLAFRAGDITTPVFAPGSLDAVFDCSVLHHVTTFGGYDHQAAARALAVQAEALRTHGVLIVRDFVDPGAGDVLLDLPTGDGDGSEDPRTASSAALFERFAREFRSLSRSPGFAFERVEGAPAGRRRYRLSRKLAAEFLLRKDYRADWESEVQEEYTYFTQAEFEALFARLGLRLLASTPLRNPWVVRHRLEGKVEVRDLDGEPLDFPPTNYLIAGEKVPAGEGVRFREAGPAAPLGFLRVEHHRHRVSGVTRDLVRRPHLTLDVLPYFQRAGETFVVARMSYPRPILASDPHGTVAVDGSTAPHYVTEPLCVIAGDKPAGQTVEEALEARAGVAPGAIRGFRGGATYYPSPGGLQEEVRSVLVEIEPMLVEDRIDRSSGLSTSGRVRAIEAGQVLRAAQVGGLPDARLELNVYELLLQLGRDPGPWIGESIEPAEGAAAPLTTSLAALRQRPARRLYERVAAEQSRGFLELLCARFEELDGAGQVVASKCLEMVVPRPVGHSTVVTAPLWRHAGAVHLGIDDDDLPAAQSFNGNSQLLVAPAWRLPRSLSSLRAARAWVRERLGEEYDADCGRMWELGGRYYPSAGATPEVVYPVAVEIRQQGPRGRRLHWVPLADLVQERCDLLDGHLRIAALRAAHALGCLGRRSSRAAKRGEE